MSETATGSTQLNFETSVIERIASTYPEEVREHFLWLAEFASEHCGRNLDALEHKVKQLGFTTTAGTFSKIFRGRWLVNNVPVMSFNIFVDLVEKLRANPDLIEAAEQINFMESPQYQVLSNYISVRRAPSRICKFGMIFGPTGAQKTASYKHFCSLPGNNRSCKWIEAPYKPLMSHFINGLAKAYKIPVYHSISRKIGRIMENLSAKKCLIVDNVQRLYKTPDGRVVDGEAQEIFNFLQRAQDETGFTPILSATPEFYAEFIAGIHKGYFEQFEGRVGGRHEFLVLPHYTPLEDILFFANKFGLQDAESHVGYLSKLVRMPGRIRVFLQTLDTAKQEAVEANSPLTIDFVREVLSESVMDRTLKTVEEQKA